MYTIKNALFIPRKFKYDILSVGYVNSCLYKLTPLYIKPQIPALARFQRDYICNILFILRICQDQLINLLNNPQINQNK